MLRFFRGALFDQDATESTQQTSGGRSLKSRNTSSSSRARLERKKGVTRKCICFDNFCYHKINCNPVALSAAAIQVHPVSMFMQLNIWINIVYLILSVLLKVLFYSSIWFILIIWINNRLVTLQFIKDTIVSYGKEPGPHRVTRQKVSIWVLIFC